MKDRHQINIDTKNIIETVAGAAFSHGLVPDAQADFIKERGDKQLIVIAATPKSGSTFLANTLSKITGLNYFRLCAAYSTNEHDLYLPALCLINPYGCVSQLHMKGTFHNAALMRTFGVKPVILVRQIYDTVTSLKNDFRRKEEMPGYGTGQNGYSFMWQNEAIKNLDDEQLIDAIIDLAIPWYVNFYVSWHSLCEQRAVDAIWITYNQLFSEKEETLKTIMAFLGCQNAGEIDQEILSIKYKTFRSGGSGEGVSELTTEQKTRIRRYFAYYSDIDFSKYGI